MSFGRPPHPRGMPPGPRFWNNWRGGGPPPGPMGMFNPGQRMRGPHPPPFFQPRGMFRPHHGPSGGPPNMYRDHFNMKRKADFDRESSPEPKFSRGHQQTKPANIKWAETYDEILPESLMVLCQPQMCELCEVNFNSPVQSQNHYESDSHDESARIFLQKWAREFDQTAPLKKSAPVQIGNAAAETILNCDVCDVGFLSSDHHFMHINGEAHARRVKNQEMEKSKPDGSSSDGLGKFPRLTEPDSLSCDLCHLSFASKDHLNEHLQCKAHLLNIIKQPFERSTGPKSHAKPRNLNIFRTPSGQYYCSDCNVRSDTEKMFSQHLDSRLHRQKSVNKKSQTSDVAWKKLLS